MFLIFQFDMNHGNPIDKECYIKTPVPASFHILRLKRPILIDNLIYTRTANHMLIIQYNKMQRFIPSLDMDIYLATFPNKPFPGILKRSVRYIILNF